MVIQQSEAARFRMTILRPKGAGDAEEEVLMEREFSVSETDRTILFGPTEISGIGYMDMLAVRFTALHIGRTRYPPVLTSSHLVDVGVFQDAVLTIRFRSR